MIKLDRIVIGGLLLAALNAAHAADGQKIFTQGGAQPGAMACVACHGADGMGLAAAGFPRLAGLPAAYLSKQLQDFKSGTRTNPVMEPLAKALTTEEIAAVTATIAAMPAPQTPLVNRSTMPKTPAEKLALQGAWDRQIPACTSCHGPGGAGVGSAFPPLANQPASYLVAQLNGWRDGTRRNDPNDLMGHVAKSMTAEEIKAVADYFASLDTREVK